MLVLLALCHPFGFLCFYAFFACLPTCSCISLCFVHTSIQWSYGNLMQTYIYPRPFCLITCLFALSCASHVCLPPFGIFSYLVFSMLSLLFVSLLVCWLVSFYFACTHIEQGYLEQGCNLLGTSKKGKDASPQKAIISRLGGLAPLECSSLSLSLSLFSRACIRVPIHVCPFLFLLFAWATFPRYDNVCFTFPVPC